MKILLFVFVLLSVSITAIAQSGNVPGIFDGRTPCQEMATLLNEQTTADCIKIKFRLILYASDLNKLHGTFSLEGFVFRGEHVLKGSWKIITGSHADPNATVYQLQHPVRGTLYFQQADADVLLFLDRDKKIMVGNKDFSYALYRAKTTNP
jgi:hypothetical protein